MLLTTNCLQTFYIHWKGLPLFTTMYYILSIVHEKKYVHFFGGNYDLIKLSIQTNYISKWWNIHEKLIETITTSIFYLEFKESNDNDVQFCYFSCLGQYCFRPRSMAAQNYKFLTTETNSKAFYIFRRF